MRPVLKVFDRHARNKCNSAENLLNYFRLDYCRYALT